MAFIDDLADAGVVAVIRGASAQAAIDISAALVRGGIRGIELTYSTPDCCRAIAAVREQHGGDAMVGVGTVTSVDQLHRAVEAGAGFAVSPHFDPAIVDAAKTADVAMLPGAMTPTEIVTAHAAGAAAVKIFPGSAVGPGFVKAVRGPLPHIPLMPTGGVSLGTMADWFKAGCVAVGMGGNLASGSPQEVEAAAAAVVAELRRIREHDEPPKVLG